MDKSFKLNVNDSFEFDLKSKDVSNLDAIPISNSNFHILHQNKSYKAKIEHSNFSNRNYKVKVNNNTYNINIYNDLDLLINKMGFSVNSTKHVNSIKAPMPGLILEINVKVGQNIRENDTLFILEAMKMENIISSPRDGIIKSISANKGEAVEKNQLIIEFE